MYKFNYSNIGEIQNDEHSGWYTYRETSNPWAKENGLKHEIDVLDGVRFANVKKTVVYVAVDEAADGSAVLEKWNLRKHVAYSA
jgi:hypothetical protein